MTNSNYPTPVSTGEPLDRGNKTIHQDFIAPFKMINHNSSLNIVSKSMSRQMTKAEQLVWFNIFISSKTGYKFTKQKIIYNFIIDFYCSKLLLAIEIDGDTHNNTEHQDKSRDDFLNNINIFVLRIKNEEVYNSLDQVKIQIDSTIKMLQNSPYLGGRG